MLMSFTELILPHSERQAAHGLIIARACVSCCPPAASRSHSLMLDVSVSPENSQSIH